MCFFSREPLHMKHAVSRFQITHVAELHHVVRYTTSHNYIMLVKYLSNRIVSCGSNIPQQNYIIWVKYPASLNCIMRVKYPPTELYHAGQISRQQNCIMCMKYPNRIVSCGSNIPATELYHVDEISRRQNCIMRVKYPANRIVSCG